MTLKRDFSIERGEAISITLNISPAQFEEGDALFFTVKKCYDNDYSDSSACIKETITDLDTLNTNPIVMVIDSDKTIKMKPGRYVYDITPQVNGGYRVPLVEGSINIGAVATLRGVQNA